MMNIDDATLVINYDHPAYAVPWGNPDGLSDEEIETAHESGEIDTTTQYFARLEDAKAYAATVNGTVIDWRTFEPVED